MHKKLCVIFLILLPSAVFPEERTNPLEVKDVVKEIGLMPDSKSYRVTFMEHEAVFHVSKARARVLRCLMSAGRDRRRVRLAVDDRKSAKMEILDCKEE